MERMNPIVFAIVVVVVLGLSVTPVAVCELVKAVGRRAARR